MFVSPVSFRNCNTNFYQAKVGGGGGGGGWQLPLLLPPLDPPLLSEWSCKCFCNCYQEPQIFLEALIHQTHHHKLSNTISIHSYCKDRTTPSKPTIAGVLDHLLFFHSHSFG